MDSQVVSRQNTYQFIPPVSLEFQQSPEWPFDPPIVPSPSVYNKHSHRRAFDRIYVMSVAQAIFAAGGKNCWPRIFGATGLL